MRAGLKEPEGERGVRSREWRRVEEEEVYGGSGMLFWELLRR